jgi:Tfp pilus assembly protein PilW
VRIFVRRQTRRKAQAGLTMIELLIACTVFTICMLGVVPLFMIAIGNNGRSKVDTTSTELGQSVIEQITAILAGGGPGFITDCGNPATSWPVAGTATPAGEVPLTADGKAIDFTAATQTGYHMDFVVCGDSPTTGAVYDVRWRVDSISGTTDMVTVSARPKVMAQKRFAFSLPVTLKTYVGPQ